METLLGIAGLITPEQPAAAARNAFGECYGVLEANGDTRSALGYAALIAAVSGAGRGEIVTAPLAIGYSALHNQAVASAWYLWTAEAIAGDGEELVDRADYDHVPLLLALFDSARDLTATWADIRAARTAGTPIATVPVTALPGMAPVVTTVNLPGMVPVAPAIDPALANVVPADFGAVYGMTREQGSRSATQTVLRLPIGAG